MCCDLGAGAERQGCTSDGAAPPLQGGVRVEGLRWPFCKDAAASLAKVDQSRDGLVSVAGTGNYMVKPRGEVGVVM